MLNPALIEWSLNPEQGVKLRAPSMTDPNVCEIPPYISLISPSLYTEQDAVAQSILQAYGRAMPSLPASGSSGFVRIQT